MIRAVGFHRNLKKKNQEAFIISLYEIDRIIEDQSLKVSKEESPDKAEILKKLKPKGLYNYLDAFSKKDLDTLSLYRACDLKIELTAENTLGYSPLYKYTAEELQTAKQYIIENLAKGFIVPS